VSLTLSVNGVQRQINAPSDQKLLYVLRDTLGMTGTKYGCGEGQCGACTVLLEGKPVRSCLAPVRVAAGKKVTTIEGLEHDGKLHPVRQAFLKVEAFQCGYCTSGMILSAVGLLSQNSNPTDKQIIDYMNGNLCRCGTQPLIVEAIRQAAAIGKD
jgi:aerobic-type carbon monoxide dehydrogenase small subunit (CoxS/CutS family)